MGHPLLSLPQVVDREISKRENAMPCTYTGESSNLMTLVENATAEFSRRMKLILSYSPYDEETGPQRISFLTIRHTQSNGIGGRKFYQLTIEANLIACDYDKADYDFHAVGSLLVTDSTSSMMQLLCQPGVGKMLHNKQQAAVDHFTIVHGPLRKHEQRLLIDDDDKKWCFCLNATSMTAPIEQKMEIAKARLTLISR